MFERNEGYSAVDHHACLAGEWDHVRGQLFAMGRTASGVSQGLRELKDFYGLPDDTLWVTTANGHLWWTFGEGPVLEIANAGSDGPSRYRRTGAGWCKSSLTGEPLSLRSLSSASVLGKDQADVDLILTRPTIGETAWVQIKSKTSQAELNDYLGRFRRDGSCDRFFFVCHSAAGALSLPTEPGLHLWSDVRLSEAAIDAGLYSWLIDRSR